LSRTRKRSPFSAEAPGRDHDALPAVLGGAHEHVGDEILRAGNFLHEVHALGVARLTEHAGRDLRHVAAAVHLAADFLGVGYGPRRKHQREQCNQQHQRRGERQHGTDPLREAHAGGEPYDHLGVAVAARERHQHRNEEREREQHRQVVDQGEAEERHDAGGGDGAGRRLPEQPHQHRGEDNADQDDEDRRRRGRELAQKRGPEDHLSTARGTPVAPGTPVADRHTTLIRSNPTGC
jgi:hypothetical protein